MGNIAPVTPCQRRQGGTPSLRPVGHWWSCVRPLRKGRERHSGEVAGGPQRAGLACPDHVAEGGAGHVPSTVEPCRGEVLRRRDAGACLAFCWPDSSSFPTNPEHAARRATSHPSKHGTRGAIRKRIS